MLALGKEGSPLIEINGGKFIRTVTFAANGEYIVGGGDEVASGRRQTNGNNGPGMFLLSRRVQGWQMDRSRDTPRVYCVGRKNIRTSLLAQGGSQPHLWRQFLARLVIASHNCTATVFDVATREKVQTLDHGISVRAAKYSPHGDRQPLVISFESGTATMAACSCTSQ